MIDGNFRPFNLDAREQHRSAGRGDLRLADFVEATTLDQTAEEIWLRDHRLAGKTEIEF